jgi:hypothetical protein
VLFKDSKQVFAIADLGQRFRQPLELRGVDEAHPVSDFVGAANLHALPAAQWLR